MILLMGKSSFSKDVERIIFPTTAAKVHNAMVELEECSMSGSVHIVGGEGFAEKLVGYISTDDLFSETGIQKLNQLSEVVDAMDHATQQIFVGALRAESVNGVNDVLRIASSLEQYEFIEGVTSDKELGGWVVEHGLSDVNFPKETWPYLDYAGLGAKFYADHGGAYTAQGYVKRREDFTSLEAEGSSIIHLTLTTSKGDVQFSAPYLTDLIPLDAVTVEEANELAGWLQQMEQEDGSLAKYCAVLEVECRMAL